MLLDAKLNDISQKSLWVEAVHTCKHVINHMAKTGSTKSPLEKLYGEKPEIFGSFLEFGRIGYFTKPEKIKNQMTEKAFKAIMEGDIKLI